MKKSSDMCAVKHCRQEHSYVYYTHPMCRVHWEKDCDPLDAFNLKEELGIHD